MVDHAVSIDLRNEVEGLLDCLVRGDSYASVHLARLFEADRHGVFRPFAEVIAARLCDHLSRYAEIGVTDPYQALEDEVYGLIQAGAGDWDKRPRSAASAD